VFSTLSTWLEHRTGIMTFVRAMLLEGVPGGAKWRYVWGSCLAFVFSIQLITGLFLMTAYSPSSSQAWSSVHFIQYKMDFGWLIRGLHHFGSQTMMVLIALHMLQVVIAGAQLPPREVNWWLGIGLLSVTFGLSLTGYLLPWDQKGYWATRVATNISSNIPVIGNDIKQLAVGGPDYGNHTLTRFYALHVAILPLSLIVLLIAHIVIFRRHGVTSAENEQGLVPDAPPEASLLTQHKEEAEHEPFWPRQAFYDMVACMAVFSVMMGLVLYGFAHEVEQPKGPDGAEPGWYEKIARAGVHGKGAELDAAADRDTANYPARPEWYFLFLFQLLKYFKGDLVLVGTVHIPNGVMVLLTILPFFGYGAMRKFGHFFGMFVVMSLLIVVGILTLFALRDDQPDGILFGLLKSSDENTLKLARQHQENMRDAEKLAKRACQLAMDGTPVEGGHLLIRNDPLTTGQKLFQVKCGSCHSFTANAKDKELKLFDDWVPKDKNGKANPTASDLGDFGTKEWVRSLLEDPMRPKHFGAVKKPVRNAENEIVKGPDGKPELTNGLGTMANWRKGIDKARKKPKDPVDPILQDADFDAIAAYLEILARPRDERKDEKAIFAGQTAFDSEFNKCSDCHRVEKAKKVGKALKWEIDGGETAPDLSFYGSADWIRGMIMSPGHKDRYGKKNLMPGFRNTEGPGSELSIREFHDTNPPPDGLKETPLQHLSDVERELIIRWIRRDYRPVYGGAVIAK